LAGEREGVEGEGVDAREEEEERRGTLSMRVEESAFITYSHIHTERERERKREKERKKERKNYSNER